MTRKIFTILLLLMPSICIWADEGEEGENSESNPTVLTEEDPLKNRPNSLNSEVIVCYVGGNKLSFALPSRINSASVSIYNQTEGWIGFITRENNSVVLPLSSGEYTIELQTNDGRLFSGVISF